MLPRKRPRKRPQWLSFSLAQRFLAVLGIATLSVNLVLLQQLQFSPSSIFITQNTAYSYSWRTNFLSAAEQEVFDRSPTRNMESESGLRSISFPNFTKVTNQTSWLVAEVARGRLGNNMFQYGSAYGVFRDKFQANQNLQLCVADRKRPRFRNLTKFYVGPFAPLCNPSVKVTRILNETGYGTYTKFDIESEPPGSVTLIREYLISFRYFDKVKQEIHHMYQLKRSAKQRQRDSVLKSQPANATLVGIHVRRTDIARDKSYRNPPMDYYRRAMQYFLDKYENVAFIIASDEKSWCARQPVFANATIIPESYEPVVEMAVLSHCHHMIISIGTYGWWAGYLGGGEVVYWKNVFNMEHPKHKDFLNLDDYYPSNWIGLD
jgi:galactoside 2-L-fucosyltransferase 1/2